MAWILLAIVAMTCAFAGLWLATRPGRTALPAGPGLDVIRSSLALAASATACVAGLDLLADRTIEFAPAAWLLLAGAAGAAALALVPADRRWSDRRRLVAGSAGALWAAAGVALWPFAVMVSACACSSAGPSYVPPAPLGLEARSWYEVAVLVGALGLLVAGSRLPDRVGRAEQGVPK